MQYKRYCCLLSRLHVEIFAVGTARKVELFLDYGFEIKMSTLIMDLDSKCANHERFCQCSWSTRST
jgi:hypothetical protein